jgi:hypothetical protein
MNRHRAHVARAGRRAAHIALGVALVSLLASAAPAQSSSGAKRRPAPPDAVVRSLYTDHFAHQQNIATTFQRKRVVFAPELRRLMDESFRKQRANPDEIVGLDFNPLTNAQEEANSFEVGSPIYEQTEAVVPVKVVFGTEPSTIRVRLVLIAQRWYVSNVMYDEGDLLAILKSP